MEMCSDGLTIQHEATTGIRAMFGDRWCVRRGTEYVAEFIHESDARRFVAGERAVEACRAAKPVIDAIVNAFPVHNDGDIIKAKNLIDSALSTLTTEGTK